MLDSLYKGRRILVVEDDYLLAEALHALLVEAGVQVVGPVSNVADALALVTSGAAIDGALLDVNVRGQAIFPVADALLERGVPFSFCSGYERHTLPLRFAHLSYCMKPYNPQTITTLLSNQAQAVEHH
ncbi:hypothetical protein ASF73_03425 [Xanthomonas sp. Leaf131]|nr:hypothetical protein ASF73_03425 [Xanthomonas sp. Leaf131]